MKRIRIALVAMIVFMLASPAIATDFYQPMSVVPKGDVAGGDEVIIPLGGIRGLRNIQCGQVTTVVSSLNCDIGAGSTKNPGNIALNYDVGRCTKIYDGHKKLLASFCPNKIVFHKKIIYKVP